MRSRAVLIFISFAVTLGAQPVFRLGNQVVPAHYAVDLTLTPGEDTFQGIVDISLRVNTATNQIWLDATGLKILSAEVHTGGTSQAAKVQLLDDRVAGFNFDENIPTGAAHLRIQYSGKISRKSSAGIFQLQEGGKWYLYTQFEPTDARRAFPCFDEPAFKVPWQLTLDVPRDLKAFANTPQTSESAQNSGRKIVKFAETHPLPSYLVAFAVGAFDVVDAGTAGSKHTRIRIITPQGKAAEAKYAAGSIPALLAELEKYFGLPYPYEKLDSIAMPFSNFAMENAGLITYSEQTLLADPSDDTLTRQRDFAIVAAHEMAHQWFGDLVTTAWWDDTWLNEGFASWMETKIVNEWKPEWHVDVQAVEDRLNVMKLDSLVSARKIRQPIVSESDIANAFDDITYSKGAAVMRMFENWIGAETFRKGVHAYLVAHADRNATTEEFLAAISAAAGKNVAPAFDTFLDQPGVPLVTAQVRCDQNHAALQLSEKRYLPLGSPGRMTQTASQVWQVPVCVRYGTGAAGASQCVLLTKHSDEAPLLKTTGCPAWLEPNAGGNGYYHAAGEFNAAELDHDAGLSIVELVSTLGDEEALVESGDVKAATALALVPQFAQNPERHVVSADMDIARLTESDFMTAETWPRAATFIDSTFGPRARQLGWKPKDADNDEVRLLRHDLARFAADRGDDKELIRQARALTEEWLKDPKTVAAGMLSDVLVVSAEHGDRDLFNRLHAAAVATTNQDHRRSLLRALGAFRDPTIVEDAMALLLTNEFDSREAFGPLLFGPLQYPATRDLPFAFLKQHLDDLLKRLPREVGGDFAAQLPEVGRSFCDAEHRDELQAFFKDRVKDYFGGARTLAQTVEQINLCIAQRRVVAPDVEHFLAAYANAAGTSSAAQQ